MRVDARLQVISYLMSVLLLLGYRDHLDLHVLTHAFPTRRSSELRAAKAGKDRFALDMLYARAKAKMWDKVERLRQLPDLVLSDFGTRRRHGFLWQRWCVEAVKEDRKSTRLNSSH